MVLGMCLHTMTAGSRSLVTEGNMTIRLHAGIVGSESRVRQRLPPDRNQNGWLNEGSGTGVRKTLVIREPEALSVARMPPFWANVHI